ncbi:hypothetical protein BS636_03695 [Acinetobacter sp. LoGeW2-3]|uniref:hypothetical protein n=1 Tax=Acinetobacter sp. LoGeW2-3 TaxID=1808001 RepID=UPI000C05C5C7|nr:hypothetical protein [Acinetobacter sp. LoGeW2-3]ATO18830.1 hypothetical protein BS636_03695 [Acinetobacter sp. LoGeW2-3]
MKKINKSCLICFSNNNNIRQAIINLRFVLESIEELEHIALWSRLASALTDIKFDSYEHQELETYLCDLYEFNREDDEYYEKYMLELTRFMYLYNILEYIAPKKGNQYQPDIPKFRNNIEKYSIDSYPIYTEKYCEKYIAVIKRGLQLNYLNDQKIEKFINNKEASNHVSTSFYLLTNIRNLLAHGRIKVVPNPDFTGDHEEALYFSTLFRASTIIVVIYIQLYILNNYKKFNSEHIIAYRSDYDIFPLDEKFISLIKTNHLLSNSPLISLGILEEENIFDEVNHYLVTQ